MIPGRAYRGLYIHSGDRRAGAMNVPDCRGSWTLAEHIWGLILDPNSYDGCPTVDSRRFLLDLNIPMRTLCTCPELSLCPIESGNSKSFLPFYQGSTRKP